LTNEAAVSQFVIRHSDLFRHSGFVIRHFLRPTDVSKTLAYLQLVRLPNVFTAIADVAMGFFVTQWGADERAEGIAAFGPVSLTKLALLATASACLYSAGMALNDLFDVEIDRTERPERPIPSGRVSLSGARGLGLGLLAGGVFIATLLSITEQDYRPALVGAALASAVFAYDRVIKRTALGPIGMGLCRFLNVLLGMSLSPAPWATWNFVVASGIGVYIVGVTWFARTEARPSNRLALALATLVGAAGVLLLVFFPRFAETEGLMAAIQDDPRQWNMLWALLGVLIAWRCVWAIADPRPALVQRAVRQCIFSLVMLDAVVTFAVAGIVPAVLIMLLLLPTMFLGQFIYST
jgi:4-hydroxybenzoate polyprenyltransferase